MAKETKPQAAEPKKETPEAKEKQPKPNKEAKKIKELEEALAKASADANHWKNQYYKAYADTENLRKSIEKDHQEALKYRAEGFVANLLPILDGFHMALSMEVKSEEVKNYLIGFQYIYNNMVEAISNEGVKEIGPKVGDVFDEKTMQAVDTEITENAKEVNTISKVNAKGYMLKDHLVRPAMVVVKVAPKKEEPKVKKDDEKKHDA